MKIKYEDIDRIINILQESKKKLKPGEAFEFENKKLNIINDFKLPEKWCVLRTRRNHTIINNWFKSKGYGSPFHYEEYIAIRDNIGYFAFDDHELPEDYIILSFEQFKKYVLDEH